MLKRTEVPFEFSGCVELRQMLGLSAEDEQELVDCLEQVSLDSVYYHTHGSLLRHRFRAGIYANDFATWAAIEVRDRVLGERLAVLNPLDFETLEDLKDGTLSVLDDHLKSLSSVPRVINGQPFYFIESRILHVPIGMDAYTLEQFRDGLGEAHESAIYYHAVEARVRLERRQNDFCTWLRDGLDLPGLVARIQTIDPFIVGLERMRAQILMYCGDVLMKGQDL
jgi:hypothetical protein